MAQKKTSGLEDLFGEDEVVRSLDGITSPEEMFKIKGIVYLAEVTRILNLSPHHLRLFAHAEEKKGVDLYETYGIRKDVGKWKIHMGRFSKQLNYIKKHLKPKREQPKYQIFPPDITREEFFNLEGTFKLNQVMDLKLNDGKGFMPLLKKEVMKLVKQSKLEPSQCGVWQDGKLYYCQFEHFLPWILSVWRRIGLEEARALVDLYRG